MSYIPITLVRPFANYLDAQQAMLEAGFELLYRMGPDSVGGTCRYWHQETREEVDLFFSYGRGALHNPPPSTRKSA